MVCSRTSGYVGQSRPLLDVNVALQWKRSPSVRTTRYTQAIQVCTALRVSRSPAIALLVAANTCAGSVRLSRCAPNPQQARPNLIKVAAPGLHRGLLSRPPQRTSRQQDQRRVMDQLL